MIDAFKNMFGLGAKTDYAQLVKDGAVIVDVRTRGEFESGHIKGAVNIPLDQLQNNLGKINKSKTIITCCASGMRSAAAKNLLKSKGYGDVYNGGGWSSLNSKL